MTDLDVLNQMIADSAKLPLEKEYRNNYVTLTEPKEADSSVKITGIPTGSIVIKVDNFKSPDTIFTSFKGHRKRADYVIVADDGTKKRILVIELKRSKGSNKSIVNQLKGAACFLCYCQEIGKQFWDEADFLKGYQYRYISFCHTSIRKQGTQPKKTEGDGGAPEKMMKFCGGRYHQFRHLAGK